MEFIKRFAVIAHVIGACPCVLAPSITSERALGFLKERLLGEGDVLFDLRLLGGEFLLAPLEAVLVFGGRGESPLPPSLFECGR